MSAACSGQKISLKHIFLHTQKATRKVGSQTKCSARVQLETYFFFYLALCMIDIDVITNVLKVLFLISIVLLIIRKSYKMNICKGKKYNPVLFVIDTDVGS